MIILPILGAIICRIHGGGIVKIPKSYVNILWALPFVYLVYTYNPWLAIPALIMCAVLKGTGHGQYYSLNGFIQKTNPERLDFIVKWFFGEDPKEKLLTLDFDMTKHYWRCVFGLSVVGLAAVSGGLLIAPYNPLGAVAIALAGLMKPIGYMIGWKLWHSPKSTEFGEYVTGFVAYLPLAFLI